MSGAVPRGVVGAMPSATTQPCSSTSATPERRGTGGRRSGDRDREAADEGGTLRGEPFLRRLVAKAERLAAGLEAHGRPEQEARRPRRLKQEEGGLRILHRQDRQA